jgi:hypothetical protein
MFYEPTACPTRAYAIATNGERSKTRCASQFGAEKLEDIPRSSCVAAAAIDVEAPSPVRLGQRSVHIWENPKCSIKPRSFENRAHGFPQTTQEKLAAICFDLLHG